MKYFDWTYYYTKDGKRRITIRHIILQNRAGQPQARGPKVPLLNSGSGPLTKQLGRPYYRRMVRREGFQLAIVTLYKKIIRKEGFYIEVLASYKMAKGHFSFGILLYRRMMTKNGFLFYILPFYSKMVRIKGISL